MSTVKPSIALVRSLADLLDQVQSEVRETILRTLCGDQALDSALYATGDREALLEHAKLLVPKGATADSLLEYAEEHDDVELFAALYAGRVVNYGLEGAQDLMAPRGPTPPPLISTWVKQNVSDRYLHHYFREPKAA